MSDNAFTVTSNSLQVTDPCYDLNVWCTARINNVKNGKYLVDVIRQNQGQWGQRISELVIYHESVYDKRSRLKFRWKDSNIGVDSGQAGFFDYQSLANIKVNETLDKSFYNEMCEYTLDSDQVGCNDFGVVSASGFGDGVYSLYVAEQKGEVVAAKIIFIDENNDEMEEF